MKLSEAIRLGATLHPQGYGSYMAEDYESDYGEAEGECHIHTCALGAAFEAATQLLPDADLLERYDQEDQRVQDILLVWQDNTDDPIWTVIANKLDFGAGSGTLKMPNDDWLYIQEAVVILNDDECWTREKIADYLAEQGF